ncbi:MAG: hypothetical protein RL172_2939 [Bacteroidota bacterium]
MMYVYKMEPLKKFVFTFLLIIAVFCARAQQAYSNLYIDVANINDSVLLAHCPVFADTLSGIDITQAAPVSWTPLSAYKIKSQLPKKWVTKMVYLQISLQNSGTRTDTVFLYPGFTYNRITTYQLTDTGKPLLLPDMSRADGYQPFFIPPGARHVYVVALKPAKTIYNSLAPQLIKSHYVEHYKKFNYYKSTEQQAVGYLFSGILIMMFFFSFTNYVLSYKKEFLYNSCYAGCMFLLIVFTTYFERQAGVWRSFFSSYAAFILLAVGTIFYIAFTRKFLNTRAYYPKLDKLFKWEQWWVFVIILSFTFFNFFTDNYSLQFALENLMKITALIIGVIYIIFSLTQRNRLMNYLAIGNSILILCSIISFYILFHPMGRKSIFVSAFFYYQLGIVGEIIFFLLGLTYKNRVELINKIKEQEALKRDTEKQSYETKLAVLNAKQKERNRISADMHDELGAGITAIRLYSELAKNKKDKDLTPEIEKISYSANELLNNMNAIIWAMSNNNDSLENMVAYIRSYSQEYFENTGVNCKINIEEGLPDIVVSGEIRKNVFLVVKETLNNILKHAQATEVAITLTRVPGGLSLFVQDNGIGIELDKVRRFGNGLKNMKKRMEDMGIQFTIENKNGTLVTLHYAMVL